MTAGANPLEEPRVAVEEPVPLPSEEKTLSEETKMAVLEPVKLPSEEEEIKMAVLEPVKLPSEEEEIKMAVLEPVKLPSEEKTLPEETKMAVLETVKLPSEEEALEDPKMAVLEPVELSKMPEEPKFVPEGKFLMESSADPEPQVEEKAKETQEDSKSADPQAAVVKSSSFKEESNFLSDLKEHERKALMELRSKLEEAILENKLFKKDDEPEEQKPKEPNQTEAQGEGEKKPDADVEPPKAAESAPVEAEKEKPAESAPTDADEKLAESAPTAQGKEVESANEEVVSLWGVPLLPSRGSEKTNVVLLKFLRARDFKVKEAFDMLRSTLQWRKESKIDSILEEDSLGADLQAACYMDGTDREGHPVCYNVSGIFEDGGLYQKTFGTEEGREKFLRWRIQLMEQGIRKIDLAPGGCASLLQITDLKNSPGPSKKELRTTMKQVVELLQDNYPEFAARNIFINVPFWYYAFHALLSPFLTQRTRSKMVFVRPSKVTETLLKYIPAEAIPIHYGGLKRDADTEFSVEDGGGVSEITVKASSTETVEIPAPEAGSTILWDLTVLGWEVNYREEFVPTDEGSYTIIIQKSKKMGAQDEAVRNSFRNTEPGKVVLTIENSTYKKKKALFRYKTKSP